MGFGNFVRAVGIGAAALNPGSAVAILAGASLGGSLFDSMDAQNQSNKNRAEIQAAIKTASLDQYNALITSTQAQIGQQQAVISGIGGSIGAINTQEAVVTTNSTRGQGDARSLAAENASAIRESAAINADALANINAQTEARARAFSAASGVLYQGTPEIYISDLVSTDAQRVQDITNVGNANANLAVHQGENSANQIAAGAALAMAQLEAQKAGLDAAAGEAAAYTGVINANFASGVAAINANNATYGVSTVQELSNPSTSTAAVTSAKVPGVLAGDKRVYR